MSKEGVIVNIKGCDRKKEVPTIEELGMRCLSKSSSGSWVDGMRLVTCGDGVVECYNADCKFFKNDSVAEGFLKELTIGVIDLSGE